MITGSSRGIGYQLAVTLAQRGHTVFATARSMNEALLRLAAEYTNVSVQEMDVESEMSVLHAAAKIKAYPGQLDAVVSNAGVSVPRAKQATVFTLLPEDLDAMLRVNVIGAARVIRIFDPLVRNGGTFATITSEAGAISNAFASMPGYAVSKAAENKLVSIQHATTARYRSLAIHPGRVDTDMGHDSAQITPKICAEGIADLLCGRTPLMQNEWFVNYQGEPMCH